MPATRSKLAFATKPSSSYNRVKCSAHWCTKTFNRAADMRKHADHKHLGFFYQCIHCGHKGSQKDAIETHVSSVHTGQLNSVCSCGEGFTDPSTLSKHRKSTGHAMVRAARVASGAVVRGREPGTEQLTYELLADPSYTPATYTEDSFSFQSSSEARIAQAEEPSHTIPRTSSHSSFDFGVIESCSPIPQPYQPTIQAPKDALQHMQFLPEPLGAPLDHFPPSAMDLGSFGMDSEDFTSLLCPPPIVEFGSDYPSPSLSPEAFATEYGSFPTNFVTDVQDAVLERMFEWSQVENPEFYLENFPALPPVPEQQLSFMHDLNSFFY